MFCHDTDASTPSGSADGVEHLTHKLLDRPNYDQAVDCDVLPVHARIAPAQALDSDYSAQYLPIACCEDSLRQFQSQVEHQYNIDVQSVSPTVALEFDYDYDPDKNHQQQQRFKETLFLQERQKYYVLKTMLVRLTQLVCSHVSQAQPLVHRHVDDMVAALRAVSPSNSTMKSAVSQLMKQAEAFRTEFDHVTAHT